MARQEVGYGDGSTLYLDESGGLVIVPRKPQGPRMKLELVLSREDAINLAVAIICWSEDAINLAVAIICWSEEATDGD